MSRGFRTRRGTGDAPPAPGSRSRGAGSTHGQLPDEGDERNRLERELARRRRERRRREGAQAQRAAPSTTSSRRGAGGRPPAAKLEQVASARDDVAGSGRGPRPTAGATAPPGRRSPRSLRAGAADTRPARTPRRAPRTRPEPDAATLRVRERRRRRIVARLRAVLLVLALAGIVVAWFAVPRASLFRVRQVQVVGTSAVSDLLVRNRVQPLLEGQTIYTVDRSRVEHVVMALPFVRSAHVQRHFPSGLEIRVQEYSPLALGLARGGSYLVARDGRVLTRARIGDWLNRIPMVRIRHPNVKPGDHIGDEPALRLLRVTPADFPGTLSSIEVIELRTPGLKPAPGDEPVYDITAKVADGPEIRIGRDADLPQKLLVASRLLTMFGPRRRGDITYIDVTVAARPAVGFRAGARQ